MFWKTLVIALFATGVLAEIEISETQKNSFKDKLTDLCKKVNAEDKVGDVEKSVHSFVDCVKQLVNIEQLKDEIEKAKPNGALDEVFKKYCAKTPQLKTCIYSLFDGVSVCLDDQTKAHTTTAKNSTDQLIDFVCYKDGDRIALFIAEKGPECFAAEVNEMRTCAENLQKSVSSREKLEALSPQDRCAKFDELTACVVTALEKCDTPTPANMAESLFKYMRKSSPCHEALPKE